jgi:hypothetical protein
MNDGSITYHSQVVKVIGHGFRNEVQVFRNGIRAERFEFAQKHAKPDVQRIHEIIDEL